MTTEQRFEKLETELSHVKRLNRWLLTGLVVALCLYALSWDMGSAFAGKFKHGLTDYKKQSQGGGILSRDQAEEDQASLDAQGVYDEVAASFVLVDASGNTRAVLGMFNGQADLRLYNADGNLSVSLQHVSLDALAGLAR